MVDWATWAQLYYDGAYNVFPDLVAANPGVQLERGVTDDQDLKAGLCTWRMWDPDDLYRPSNPASSLYGQTGLWMRGAFATGGSVRFSGETTSMRPGQTDDLKVDASNVIERGNRWVDVRLGGPLARVGQWRDPLASPLFTQITGAYTTLKAYYPLEDGRDSTQLANAVPGGRPGTFVGMRLGSHDGPSGSDSVAEPTSSSTATFLYPSMSTSAGFQVVWANEITAADGTLRDVFTFTTSNGYTWRWRVSNANYNLRVEDDDGSVLKDESYGFGTGAEVGQWIFTRIQATVSAGTVTVEPMWYPQDSAFLYGVTTTFSGSIGAPRAGSIPGNVATNGAGFGHHFVLTGTSESLGAYDFLAAFNGYRTEAAGDRFTRLCTNRGLPYTVRGTASASRLMGPQPVATFQDQLKQIRSTDGGLIFDRGSTIGLVMCTRGYLHEQAATPVLTLTWPDDVAPPLLEAESEVFNIVTARNSAGSSATAQLADGRLGTANPPTGSGRLDKTVDVNCATDGDLADIANWWMRYYTQSGPRFDTIVVDIDAHPELETACEAAEPGQFIELSGRTPDPLLLLILSTAEKTNRKRRVFTFGVAPGSIYRNLVWDGTDHIYSSNSTTLAEAMTTSETLWDIVTVDRAECWSTTNEPYDWIVAGERVTVTSMGAVGGSSGAWTQTATVTRSVNGVVKTHAIGEPVRLAEPYTWV